MATLGRPEGVPICTLTMPLQEDPPETLLRAHERVHGASFKTVKHWETNSASIHRQFRLLQLGPVLLGFSSAEGQTSCQQQPLMGAVWAAGGRAEVLAFLTPGPGNSNTFVNCKHTSLF